MMKEITPEQIANDVAFIIERETPDNVLSVDVAEIISAVQHYLLYVLTEPEGESKAGLSLSTVNEILTFASDKWGSEYGWQDFYNYMCNLVDTEPEGEKREEYAEELLMKLRDNPYWKDVPLHAQVQIDGIVIDFLTSHTKPELTVHEWEHMSEDDKQAWCDSHPDCFPHTEPEGEKLTPEQRVLQELVTYLDDYQEKTKDYAPGNRYWGQKLQDIVERARESLTVDIRD